MARQITLAFDFEADIHKVAHMFDAYNVSIDIGRGEHENGIPLNTIVISRRNEKAK